MCYNTYLILPAISLVLVDDIRSIISLNVNSEFVNSAISSTTSSHFLLHAARISTSSAVVKLPLLTL